MLVKCKQDLDLSRVLSMLSRLDARRILQIACNMATT